MQKQYVVMKMRRIILSILRKGFKHLYGRGINNFYPIKVVYRFLSSHLKNPNLVVEVEGSKMLLDSKDSLGLSVWGVYEPFETELFKKEILKGEVVLDIGANIGYYTLIAAKLVGENGKVFAFEPDPSNFAILQKNVEMNGYKNVILVQKAVSNETGKLRLYLCEDNKADHRIYDSHDGRKFIEIEAVRLDDYFKNYNGKVDFIKMDIQGGEGGAIQGMLLLLQKNKNVKIVTEFWPIGLRRFGIEPEEYLKVLIKHGFRLYHINEQKRRLEPITINEVMQMCPDEKFTNLLSIKDKPICVLE